MSGARAESVARCRVALRGHGLLVAWAGRWGPAVALLDTPRALAPRWSTYLGSDRALACPTPRWVGGRPVVAWVDPVGAWVWTEGQDARCVLRGATAASVDGRGDRLWVAAAGAEGLVLSRRRLVDLEEEAREVVHERADVRALALAELRTGPLVAYGLADPLLGVAAGTGEAIRDVRHALERPVRDLDARAAGTRAVLALADGSAALRAAVVDGEGRMRERAHVVLRGSGPFVEPTAYWADDAFAVAGRDAGAGALRAVRLDGRPHAGFEDVGAPAGWAYGQGSVLLATLRSRPGEGGVRDRLALRKQGVDGAGALAHEVVCTPADEAHRRRVVEARDCFERLRDLLAGVGYRDARGAAGIDPRALEGRFRGAEREVAVRLEVREGEPCRLTLATGDGSGAPPASSLLRLARWVRLRLSPAARREEAAREAWARGLVGEEVPLAAVRRDARGAHLELRPAEPPAARELLEWLRALAAAELDPVDEARG